MTEEALLLLGVTHPSSPPVFSETPHVRLNCEDWIALAVPVVLDPGEDDETRMTRWAMSQGEVLCRQVRTSDVVPVRLGAVFSTPAALRTHLCATREDLCRVAENCSGCVEFAVQIFAEETAASECAGLTRAGGRAFLDSRRRARDQRSRAASERRGFLSEIGGVLEGIAQGLTEKEVQSRAPLADWAVLLSRDSVDAMLSSLEALEPRAQEHRLRLKVTGPWPPFTFIGRC